jgi:hypothetical protein
MERDQALRFLLEDCVWDPPLNERTAETLWRPYRARAEMLPPRDARAPEPVPLSAAEYEHSQLFNAFLIGLGRPPIEVIKVDPLQLVAIQYHVAIDHAEIYRARSVADEGWMEQALPTSINHPNLDLTVTQRQFDTDIDINLPHAEFVFGLNDQGAFQPIQSFGHVAAIRMQNRLILLKGYHRLYARISGESSSRKRPALLGIEPESLGQMVDRETKGTASERHGLSFLGRRPALTADFFTPGHFLSVFLRKKRYRLQVRATWQALNDEP